MVNLKKFEECRKLIFLRASRTDKLDRYPSVEITENIRATAYVHIGWPFDFDVTKEVLDFWGITFEELLPIARANMLREFSIYMFQDEQTYVELALLMEPISLFKVLCCGTYGAGVLAAPEVLKSAMSENSDYFIIPLSTKGLILAEYLPELPLEKLVELVTCYNREYKCEEEQLVDGVFFYRDGKLLLVKN